jgi:hypothetical protein
MHVTRNIPGCGSIIRRVRPSQNGQANKAVVRNPPSLASAESFGISGILFGQLVFSSAGGTL